jgi:hypothetical protein
MKKAEPSLLGQPRKAGCCEATEEVLDAQLAFAAARLMKWL